MLSINFVAIGLDDLNHPVERGTLDEQLHGLVVKLTRTEIAAKDGLEVKWTQSVGQL